MSICFHPAPFDAVRMLGQAAPSATRNGDRSILSPDGHSAGFIVKPGRAVAFGGLAS